MVGTGEGIEPPILDTWLKLITKKVVFVTHHIITTAHVKNLSVRKVLDSIQRKYLIVPCGQSP